MKINLTFDQKEPGVPAELIAAKSNGLIGLIAVASQ
jgi:hypothetical protein